MKPSVFLKLGMKHIQNSCFENIYLHTGIDRTKPVAFYALVNQRCNSKCQYCDFWRLEKYDQELSIEEWQNGLLSIKEFVGTYSISFSGGEPFLKKGFVELLQWCGHHGIQAGVTTNGMLLAKEHIAEKVVSARPFNLSFSIDAHAPDLNDVIRGVGNSFSAAQEGIENVLRLKKKMGVEFPVILKPTITSLNYRELPGLVKWATNIGMTSINMQPVFHWTPETYDDLWIHDQQIPDLTQIIRSLIEMKQDGYPILNSNKNLLLIIDSFMNKKAPADILPCLVGLRNFTIRPNGDVRMCADFQIIGNLKDQSAKDVWYSDIAQSERANTIACSKLCLMTCTSQKTFLDKFKIAKALFSKSKTPAREKA